MTSERRSAIFSPAGSGRHLDDDRSVAHKPPFLPPSKTSGSASSSTRQKQLPPKSSCARDQESIHRVDSKQSRDAGGRVPSATSTYSDRPNTIGVNPLAASAELIQGFAPYVPDPANRGVQPYECQPSPPKQFPAERADRVPTGCSNVALPFQRSDQDIRNTGKECEREVHRVSSERDHQGSQQAYTSTLGSMPDAYSRVPQHGTARDC